MDSVRNGSQTHDTQLTFFFIYIAHSRWVDAVNQLVKTINADGTFD